MNRLIPIFFLASVASSGLAHAQASAPMPASQAASDSRSPRPARTSPEEMQKAMDSAMSNMAPMMVKMTEATMEAQLAVGARPETAERVAAFKRNLYEALLKKGFTPSQAMQITSATAMPPGAGR